MATDATTSIDLDDSSRLKLPLKWLLALVVGCVSMGGAWAMTQVQLSNHSDEIRTAAASIKERERVDNDLEARQRVDDERYSHIMQGIDRLQRSIDAAERRHHAPTP